MKAIIMATEKRPDFSIWSKRAVLGRRSMMCLRVDVLAGEDQEVWRERNTECMSFRAKPGRGFLDLFNAVDGLLKVRHCLLDYTHFCGDRGRESRGLK